MPQYARNLKITYNFINEQEIDLELEFAKLINSKIQAKNSLEVNFDDWEASIESFALKR